MKVLSKATIYSLRALIYMAGKESKDTPVTIGEISENLEISFHFLTKSFQLLTQKGILESLRGPSGGIFLNKPVNKVFLIDVINILEGEDFFDTCMLGLPGCGEREPCPVHMFWKDVRGKMKMEFQKTTLAHLAEKVQTGKMRI
ncbi:MAG: Rrf2 family transcriptional regulator [Saprospiraceae bacterium]|nr:Rrf2 family transcriptional regulator [Candidatus Vicinibacter affinis]MBK8642038.1 Rrf2 family transcriptional regulator [Candidatus Vicinibacter affinis]